MNTDSHYITLGVEENASQDEIKKAYRKLAKENHPDKGGDEELFKKISVAYDTIGDEEKRKQYDIERKNPFAGMGGGFGGSFNDLFNSVFGQQRQEPRVHTTNMNVELTVLESFLSSKKEIIFSRKKMCEPCTGTGGDKVICTVCNGSGQILKQFGNGMFNQVISMQCEVCSGKGSILKNPCHSCSGEGSKTEMHKVEINIPHGIDDGQFFRLKGQGDFRNGVYGDLIIRVFLKNESNFEKFGNNLVYNKFFNLDDFKNENFLIPHPDGDLKISFPKNIDTSRPLRIKGKGFKNDGVGDLLINQFLKYSRD